jgi:hypothetical protein
LFSRPVFLRRADRIFGGIAGLNRRHRIYGLLAYGARSRTQRSNPHGPPVLGPVDVLESFCGKAQLVVIRITLGAARRRRPDAVSGHLALRLTRSIRRLCRGRNLFAAVALNASYCRRGGDASSIRWRRSLRVKSVPERPIAGAGADYEDSPSLILILWRPYLPL